MPRKLVYRALFSAKLGVRRINKEFLCNYYIPGGSSGV
jgi:hypothetical protein